MDGGRLSDPSGDYRGLFDQSPAPFALVFAGGEPRVVNASRGFLDTFDRSRAALVGRPVTALLAANSGDRLAGAIRQCLTTSETVEIEVELLSGRSPRFMALMVHSADGFGFPDHVMLQVAGRGHAIRSTGQHTRSLLDEEGPGQSMTFIHDLKSHRVRYVDSGLARRFGLSGGAMHLRDFEARIHPEDLSRQSAYRATREKMGDDEHALQTVRVRDLAGEWRLVSFRSRILRRGRDGLARTMLGVATDITDYAAAAVEAAGLSVARAEGDERARLGRELHDSTSQYLVAADLGLARALQSVELSADERARLLEVQSSLGAAQLEIRAFSYFLHPPELRDFGLLGALQRFCAGFARRSGLEIAFSSHDVPLDLASEAEHALFRVCQEALMNVYRHAFARKVSVGLRSDGEYLVLEVRDDGIGVDKLDRFEQGGMGVAGMKARILSIGGDLTLDPRGPGLAVIARVPAARPDEAPGERLDTRAGQRCGS
jgi:signal transduction histidine kinase